MKIAATVKASPRAMSLLERLPDIMTRGPVLANALRAGLSITLREAQSLTPRGDPHDKPGNKPLADTEAIVVRKYDTAVVALVGPQYPAGAHGHLVALGTKPHTITAKSKKVLSGLTITRDALGYASGIEGGFFGRAVQHPGAKANNFLQAAIDMTSAECEGAILGVIGEEIERQISGN